MMQSLLDAAFFVPIGKVAGAYWSGELALSILADVISSKIEILLSYFVFLLK